MYACICTYVCICVYMYVCICMCACMCIYVCVYVCMYVTSVPSVTNVYYFFYGLPRRVSFRSLRLRLRQCLLWCRVHVCCRAAVWPRICGTAHTCCRALVMLPRTRMLPRPMVPRGRPNGLSSLCSRVPWCRVPWFRALSYCRAP